MKLINHLTQAVIYESTKAATLKELVVEASLSGANLSGASLSRASLSRAKGVISFTAGSFFCFITRAIVKIGCNTYTHKQIKEMTREKAVGLPPEFYLTYRRLILAAIKSTKRKGF